MLCYSMYGGFGLSDVFRQFSGIVSRGRSTLYADCCKKSNI